MNKLLRWGVLNVRSAANKAALIHDVIDASSFDLLVLTETNIPANAPPAIRDDLAPEGYLSLYSPRIGRKKKTGRGLAIIYRDSLDVKVVKSSFITVPSFETLCARIIVGHRRINLLGIYRPPPRATDSFFDDLATLCDNLEQLPGDTLL